MELKNISNERDLKKYLNEKALSHRNFKVYHNSYVTDSILTNKFLLLKDGTDWNDSWDSKNFNSSKTKKHFGMCFSFSRSENVAMWMLYGGMKKKGTMINFSQSDIKSVLNVEKIEFGNFSNGRFTNIVTLNKSDFRIDIYDIIYFGESNDKAKYYVKRSSEIVKEFSKEIIDKLSYLKKTMPWSYENEARLIVTVNKMSVPNDVNACIIGLSDAFVDGIKGKIYHSPNYQGATIYNKSKLNGEINWDLCQKCTNSNIN